MGRQEQGRHIGSAQPGKGLLRASLAPGAKRRNATGREAASTIRRRMGVARAVRQERLSVDVCRESQTGRLCAACLHEEIEVGNRNTKARCRIDRSAPQTCACTRRRGLRKWLKSRFTKAAVNIFTDIGFSAAEAAELTAKSRLIQAIDETIKRRKLTQLEAARRCRTDQPTLSKVLRGRMESVTIDRLTAWLTALGRTVEIRVRPYDAKAKTRHLVNAP